MFDIVNEKGQVEHNLRILFIILIGLMVIDFMDRIISHFLGISRYDDSISGSILVGFIFAFVLYYTMQKLFS